MNFNNDQISELLKSDNLHFRKIACKTIVDNFEIYSDLFFDSVLFSECEELDELVVQRFVSLQSGFAAADAFDSDIKFQYFQNYAAEHALFLNKLETYCQKISDKEKINQFKINLLNLFKGLKPDLADVAEFDKETRSERQLMIFITGKCNLSCTYCFSDSLQSKEMSLSDFEDILQWARKNEVKRISLCGGEPTSHSKFNEILWLLQKQDFTTYFASNFTVDCTNVENFNAKIIDKIFIHLTEQVLENDWLKERMLANIEHAKKEQIELVFRTNIANEKPKIAEWFDVMEQTHISALNIALTFPAKSGKNQYVDIHSFQKFVPILTGIIEKAKQKNITLSFAKPVPLCLFDEQTNRYLLAFQNFSPLCSVYEENFTHNVCITPQKEINACLGVTSASLKFTENLAWREVENFCTAVIQPLFSKPLFDRCGECFLSTRKLCQGACLSYKK
jgi:organic radical activating enzyme